jgi:DNA polymerase
MALELDTRQRAMLQEMGVHVWLPGTDFAVVPAPAQPTAPLAAAKSLATAPMPSAADHAPAAPRTADAGPASANRAATVRADNPPRGPQVPQSTAATPAPAVAMDALAASDWLALQQAAAACQACGLCAGRKSTTLLPATGTADWMVVGDPPDEDEDATASPFAGPSGVLLDNMLAALGLRRSNGVDGATDAGRGAAIGAGRAAGAPGDASAAASLAYVTNVVKCRPPHGAQVQAADLAQCAAYLQREIALVQPKMILAMGRFANQLLLGETPELANQPLGKLRGVVRHYGGIAVVPTYHPKALMRNSADKAKAWADLCLAAAALDALRDKPGA